LGSPIHNSKTGLSSIHKEKLDWPQLSLGNMAESEIVSNYGIGGVPTSILIGTEGQIIANSLHSEQIQAAISQAMNSNENF